MHKYFWKIQKLKMHIADLLTRNYDQLILSSNTGWNHPFKYVIVKAKLTTNFYLFKVSKWKITSLYCCYLLVFCFLCGYNTITIFCFCNLYGITWQFTYPFSLPVFKGMYHIIKTKQNGLRTSTLFCQICSNLKF